MPWKPIFAFFKRIMVGVMIPRVTLRSTLGYEPLATLGHSTFQVVLLRRLRVIKRVIIRRCVIMPELKESPLSQIAVAGVILLKKAF